MNLPEYQCHKRVHADKIVGIQFNGHDAYILRLDQSDDVTIKGNWVDKAILSTPSGQYSELVGGYYVVYADGYESWSPAEAFESGYTKIDHELPPMNIGLT